MLLTVQDGVVVRETGTLDLHLYRDTDGDGVADDKQLVFEGGGRGGNLEHQPTGLDWNIDNFLYVTYTNRRYRWRDGKIEAHPMPAGDGQWGMTHDDWGQCFYSRAGGEVVATSFQQNLQYGKLALPGQLEDGFHECWPIDDVPDVQGGPRRVREDGSLNHFTGCCGQSVFRGDRLPEELRGNLFVPEPVGRLIRRATVHDVAGTRVLRNPHGKSEFLRTKDANFRPINTYTAPDGTMYIVDMHRGIIQEGNWVRKGATCAAWSRNTASTRTSAAAASTGWCTKTTRRASTAHARRAERGPRRPPRAPKRLVAGQRAEAADRAQRPQRRARAAAMMRGHDDPRARMHAMWTLHGLDLLRSEELVGCLADEDLAAERPRSARARRPS